MIEVEINNKRVLTTLNHIVKHVKNRRPLMRAIAGTMKTAVDMNFSQGGRPSWLPVKHRPGGTPLNDSGLLKNSIQQYSDNDGATVGTNLVYAPIHQFGGKTKPHVIKPVFKKALAFNGIVRKSVYHPGSDIPARPFLRLTVQDEQNITHDVKSYFKQFFK
ncbi:phage virion morphogenesis protein [Pasteurella multocida]|uniref:phage virion morphogenesis protein n=1 Tax=Pasteurella multocida TaxID=747 RepID=UPI002CA49669|nr:phage virion morphogenesis protein [Pasteurella multocida]MEB3452053.1 phage virion morphogenesis protein [Pasteurella multocida]MEB3460480.1 phage virion morphogenesis protein [Pasteurella multocida]MEB3462681.1 phage virion morphogenesis protein [Pasteurella multocida]HDR1900400.1 phage virion morphogenesis protein [Pasteurella multocida]